MVNNVKTISLLSSSPSTGLTDATSKIHSGILKGLESFAYNRMIIEHGGFAIASGGGSLNVMTLTNPFKYVFDGKMTTVEANKTVSTAAAHGTHPRYDWVVLNTDDNSLSLIQGTASATPHVSDFNKAATDFDRYIPVALVYMAGGSAVDAARTFQMYTLDKNSLSLAVADDGASAGTIVEAMSITSASGVTTFENKVTNADVIFKMSGDNAAFRIESATDGANAGPTLELYRNPANAADDNLIGQINFIGEDSGNAENEYGRIQVQISDETDGTEDGQMYFRIQSAGALLYPLKFTPTTTLFNANNDNIDVRIDGDTNDFLFFADANQEQVSIGNNDPGGKFHVTSTNTGTFTALFESSDAGASDAPDVVLWRNSATPANADDMGRIRFYGNHTDVSGNASAGSHDYADIFAEGANVVTGAEAGNLRIRTALASSMVDRITMTNTETIFNDARQDFDFRIESTSGDKALWVDASTNSVAIGHDGTAPKVGFFGTTPVTKEGGVAPDVTAIHNALTRLGLFA
jgi:hypothetical protein